MNCVSQIVDYEGFGLVLLKLLTRINCSMNPTLSTPSKWAQLEFSAVCLGDSRRSERLVQVASSLAERPGASLPQVFSDWAELKGAYRFFSNKAVSFEQIATPHWQRTWQSLNEPGEYLLIEDSTDLDFSSHRSCQHLGRIGNDRGRGLLLHSTLAVRVEAWDVDHRPEVSVVGLAGQKCWARSGPSHRAKKERWRQRFKRSRESERWAQTLEQMPARPSEATWIYIADRESDIYEVFERCQQHRADFLIRAQFARCLEGEDQSLFTAVAQMPVLGTFEVSLRARPKSGARVVKLDLRARQMTLRGVSRPTGQRPPITIWVVEAREIGTPTGEQPIHWILLTSLGAATPEEARRIVARYSKRWLVEEYHKALKTGAGIEESELETADRIKALLGILAIVAVRLLHVKLQARTHPEKPVTEKMMGPEALGLLEAQFGKPRGGWTNSTTLIAIARMGGFLARKGDGSPGWITIWRGWQRLDTMIEGIMILKGSQAKNER